MNALEQATVPELIAELMRRHTFVGVVAWQSDFRKAGMTDWQWTYRGCDPGRVFHQLAVGVPEGFYPPFPPPVPAPGGP